MRHQAAAALLGLVAGGALALAAVAVLTAHDGGLAYDTRAYWLAARHLLDGTALYSQATVSDLGAYKYPPIFAQVFIPAAWLPGRTSRSTKFAVVAWAADGASSLCRASR